MRYYIRTLNTAANIKANNKEAAIIEFMTSNKFDFTKETTLLIEYGKHIKCYRTIPIAVHLGLLTREEAIRILKNLIKEDDDPEKALNKFLRLDSWVLKHLNRR